MNCEIPKNEPSFLTYREMVRSHYAPDSEHRNIAREAYEKACSFVRVELEGSTEMTALIDDQTHGIDDIRAILHRAQVLYTKSAEKKSKAMKWLNRFSARMMYYGKVMDVLSQHHPEYVSLVWGALKFVFMGVLNHEKLVAEFQKALARIGDALSLAKTNAELYQTDTMYDAIAQIYSYILLYCQRAMAWYNRSSIGRAFSALIRPWELEYKDIIEQIQICAQAINDVAMAANHAEIRDLHITVRLMWSNIQRQDQKLDAFRQQLQETQNVQACMRETANSMLEMATSHRSITERIDLNINDMQPRIMDIQFSKILDAIRPSVCPVENLHKLRSIARRAQAMRLPQTENNQVKQALTSWLTKEGSSLFLLRVGPRADAAARALVTEIVTFLQARELNVIWRLSPPRGTIPASSPSFSEIARSLIHQALLMNQHLLSRQNADEFNIGKFHSHLSNAEMAVLFQKVLSRLPKCYVVIEAEDVFRSNKTDSKWTMEFLRIFSELVKSAAKDGNALKLLVLTYGSTDGKTLTLGADVQTTLIRPLPTPVRLRKTVTHKRRQAGWQCVQPKI